MTQVSFAIVVLASKISLSASGLSRRQRRSGNLALRDRKGALDEGFPKSDAQALRSLNQNSLSGEPTVSTRVPKVGSRAAAPSGVMTMNHAIKFMSPPRRRFQLSLRTHSENADHHLWNNHGTWWCHFTLHCPTGIKHRVRRSLRTGDVLVAQKRRDALLARLQSWQTTTEGRRTA